MLTQKLILGYTSRIIAQLISMIAGIIVARIAGPTIIGTVAFGMSLVSMFTFFADLGIGNAHIKLVSEGRNLGDCIKTFTVLKSILIFVFVILLILYLIIKRFVFHIQYESPVHFYVIIIWLCTITVSQFLYIPITTFMALTQQARQDIPNLIQIGLTQIIRVVAVLIVASAIVLSFANLLGILLVVPLYLYLFRNYEIGRFDKNLARDYIKIAAPIIIMVLYGTFIGYFDKFLLQYFSNSEQVGYYTVGFSIGSLVQIVGLAVGQVFFPTFSSSVTKKDYDYINRTIEKYERFVYIFLMPVTIFFMLYSRIIIKLLLGNEFLPSSPILFLIFSGAFFFVINLHYGNLLLGAGYINKSARLSLYSLIFFISLNLIFVAPQMLNLKAIGSAFAWTINCLFLGLLFRVSVSKLIKEVSVWRNKKYWLFGLINLVVFFSFSRFISNRAIYFKIIFPVIYFSLTYITFYLLNMLRQEDIQVALRIFDIRSMKEYIKTEFKR